MAEELKIPAGSPVNINLTTPAPATREEPAELKEGKRAKREALIAEARSEGVNEVLKGLGIKKSERARMIEEIKDGRMKLAEVKDEAAKAKDEAEAAKLSADAFKPFRDEAERLKGTLKKYADNEFAALPEAFQKTIVEMKLEDPDKVLGMIEIFKRTGAVGAPAAQVKVDDVTKKPVTPSTTMATAPKDVKTPDGAALTHYEQWKQMTDRGEHYLAAQYFNVHQVKIIEQRPKTRA